MEHTLINMHQLMTCYEGKVNIWEGLRIYFVDRSYQAVFVLVEYNLWMGLVFEVGVESTEDL